MSQKVQIDTYDFGPSLTAPTLGALATGTTIANGTASTCNEQTADSGVYVADFVGADALALIPAGTYRLRTTVNGLPIKRFVTFAGVDGELVYARSEEHAVLDSATLTQLHDIETAVDANTGYLTAITSSLSTLAAKVRKYFQLSLRKDAAIATDNATELGEINANGGTGAGAFANTTDSQEAIRDNLGGGGGGGGSPVFTAVVVTRIASGTAAGWPEELIIGDAYLTANASAQPLFIKDVADNILSGLGTKLFSDADFVATLRLAPLTDGTRTLDSPPTTIEVKSTDAVGIVYNDDTDGAEYFELQIPRAKTLLGVTKTKYSCQFIMNWGDSNQFERTVNLGEIKFLRKNAPAT